jgi:hypothetical protein
VARLGDCSPELGWWRTGGGALARDGDSAGTTRTRRRRVEGVGIFAGAGGLHGQC